jgi:hypothetical protein
MCVVFTTCVCILHRYRERTERADALDVALAEKLQVSTRYYYDCTNTSTVASAVLHALDAYIHQIELSTLTMYSTCMHKR